MTVPFFCELTENHQIRAPGHHGSCEGISGWRCHRSSSTLRPILWNIQAIFTLAMSSHRSISIEHLLNCCRSNVGRLVYALSLFSLCSAYFSSCAVHLAPTNSSHNCAHGVSLHCWQIKGWFIATGDCLSEQKKPAFSRAERARSLVI